MIDVQQVNRLTSVPLILPGWAVCVKSLHSALYCPTVAPLSPQHHHRNGLQSRLHTKPDMPHLLFSHHTRCSPTPSSMIMQLSVSRSSFTVVICASDCTEQEWHTCMQLQGSAAACQSGDREPLVVPGAAARLASCKVQLNSAARILP